MSTLVESASSLTAPEVTQLPAYEVMTEAEAELFRERVKFVAETYPSAAFVGGAALRVHMDMLGLPLPKEVSGDIDLAVHQELAGQEPWYWDIPHHTGDIPLDTIDTWTPFREPYYTTESYQGKRLTVSTLAHALYDKARQYLIVKEEGHERLNTDYTYLKILESLVSPEELRGYFAIRTQEQPQRIEVSPELIDFLVSEGALR